MGSYTSKFNLFKPAKGETRGTWGDLVSGNFQTLDTWALDRNGDSMVGQLDMGNNALKQGIFKQKHNATTGKWELYVNISGSDVLFGVFEVVSGKVNFRFSGQLIEGESL